LITPPPPPPPPPQNKKKKHLLICTVGVWLLVSWDYQSPPHTHTWVGGWVDGTGLTPSTYDMYLSIYLSIYLFVYLFYFIYFLKKLTTEVLTRMYISSGMYGESYLLGSSKWIEWFSGQVNLPPRAISMTYWHPIPGGGGCSWRIGR